MPGRRITRIVLAAVVIASAAVMLTVGAAAGTGAQSTAKPLAFRVKLPPRGGFSVMVGRIRLKGAGVDPRRARLAVTNTARLPRGLVAVARINRARVGRGLDLLVIVIRKRSIRTSAAVAEDTPGDALNLILEVGAAARSGNPSFYPIMWRHIESLGSNPTDIGNARSLERVKEPDFATRPGGVSVDLVGDVKPDPITRYVEQMIDNLAAPGPPTPDTRDELTKLINKIEQQLQDDLNDDGEIGGKPSSGGGSTPPPAPPPPPTTGKLTRYSFSGLGISYSGPAGAGGKVSDVSGSVCGDPLKTTWALKGTLTISAPGQADIVRPITGPYNASLPSLPPLMRGDFGGGTSMTVRVKYNPGAKPTMEILGQPVGAISNIAYNAQSVPVAVAPKAC